MFTMPCTEFAVSCAEKVVVRHGTLSQVWYNRTEGARPIGMAILPQELSAYGVEYEPKSVEAPWILLVTAKVRPLSS